MISTPCFRKYYNFAVNDIRTSGTNHHGRQVITHPHAHYDEYLDRTFILESSWRVNVGLIPCHEIAPILVRLKSGGIRHGLAYMFEWGEGSRITHWQPDLITLEEKLNG